MIQQDVVPSKSYYISKHAPVAVSAKHLEILGRQQGPRTELSTYAFIDLDLDTFEFIQVCSLIATLFDSNVGVPLRMMYALARNMFSMSRALKTKPRLISTGHSTPQPTGRRSLSILEWIGVIGLHALSRMRCCESGAVGCGSVSSLRY